MTAAETICCVCEEPLTAPNLAECYTCKGSFHFQVMENVPSKDCGQAWIDDELVALMLTCQTCYDADPPQPAIFL